MEYILSGLETINGLLTSVLNFAVFDWELLISVIFSVYFVLRVDIFTFSYKKLIGFCVLIGIIIGFIQHIGLISWGLILLLAFLRHLFMRNREKLNIKDVDESEYTKDLQECRKTDFKNIENAINSFSIVGVNAQWGTGKTYLINKILEKKKDEGWITLTIEALQINTGTILDALFSELSKILRSRGIVRSDFLLLTGRVQWNYIISAILNFIGLVQPSSNIFNQLIRDLKQVKTPIIINFEDIDRIKDGSELRQTLDVARKIADAIPTIRILYQYDSEKLNMMGLEREYIEKYIPHEEPLSKLTFYMIIQDVRSTIGKTLFIQENEVLKSIKWREIFSYRMGDSYHLLQFLPVDLMPAILQKESYAYRTVKEFYLEANRYMNSRSFLKEKPYELLRVLYIKFCYPYLYKRLKNYTLEQSLVEYFKYELDGKMVTWKDLSKGEDFQDNVKKVFQNPKNKEIYELLSFLGCSQSGNTEFFAYIDVVVANITNPVLPALTENEILIKKVACILKSEDNVQVKWEAIQKCVNSKDNIYLLYDNNINKSVRLFYNYYEPIFNAWMITRPRLLNQYKNFWLDLFEFYGVRLENNPNKQSRLFINNVINSAYTIDEIYILG